MTSPLPHHLRAQESWDNRWHQLARQRTAWQRATFAALALNLVLFASYVHLSSRSHITPYVVEVDRHGHALAFGPAQRFRQPLENITRFTLAQLIADLRSIPGDPQALKSNLDDASHFLAGTAEATVRDWFTANNPYQRQKQNTTVRVEIASNLLKDRRANIWQIRWSEHVARPGAARPEAQVWEALATVRVHPPKTSQQALLNPLGIFIESLDWARLTH